MLKQKLKTLYEKAIEIENHSKSPRIITLHSEGKFCQVGLGTYYPESTKYMFVSLNPGGEYYLSEKQDAEKSTLEHPNFNQYLHYTFRYAVNMKKIISAFATNKRISFDDVSLKFGTTDLSFFHSRTSSELKESFFIELKESLPIFLEEISIPNLESIIFSGVPFEHFFFNLYKTGSSIKEYSNQNTLQDWVISFKTTLINEREYQCVFITHLSATRGLKDDSLISIGNKLSKLL
jgi:hypothetical protein